MTGNGVDEQQENMRQAMLSFAALLTWHLTNGTRPRESRRKSGLAWGNPDFAVAVGADERNVRNWKTGRVLPRPDSFDIILRELFGPQPEIGSPHFGWREQMRAAYEKEKTARDKLAKSSRLIKSNISAAFSHPPRNVHFVGRELEIETIHANLFTQNIENKDKTWRYAIYGLGGVGKTSLAIEYTHRFGRNYGGIVWCAADTRTTLLTVLASIVETSDSGQNLEKAARAGLRWIESQPRPWLLVYDNVDSPNTIRDFLPASATRLLITSRFGDWGSWASSFHLDILPEASSIRFIQNRSGVFDETEAAILAHTVGYLPLALDHAAAYCKQTSTLPSDYARVVGRRLGKVPPGVEYSESFAAVYELSLAIACKNKPAASIILGALSFLAPDRIPLILIEGIINDDERDDALMSLGTSSLIRHDADRTISLHPLVSLLTRSKIGEYSSFHSSVEVIAARMATLIPKLSLYKAENWPLMKTLIPHALALSESAEWTVLSGRDLLNLSIAVAQLLHTFGSWKEAEMIYRRIIPLGERLFGQEDMDVNDAISDLALVCTNMGQIEEAAELAEKAYKTAVIALGNSHATVGIRIQILAFIYQRQNRIADAAMMYRKAFEEIEIPRSRDENYIFRGNLAHLLWQQKKFIEAEKFANEAIIYADELAPTGNEYVGKLLLYLTLILRDTDRLPKARAQAESALACLQSSVGDTHAAFGWGLSILASIMTKQAQAEEAIDVGNNARRILEKYGTLHAKWLQEVEDVIQQARDNLL